MLKKILIAAALIGTLGLPLHAQETQADAEKYATQATQYYQQGNYAQALEFYNKALAIRLKVLGENHPDTAASHYSIGVLLYRSGKKTEARDHLRKAAAIARKTLGPDHPTTRQISAVLQFVENELSK